jgi:methionyl-tRNA formyltransferase
MRLIFCGSGEFGLTTLRAILGGGHEVLQIFSQPDRPAGRGRKLTPTPIAQFALERGLPLLRTANINAEPLPAADVMVVIAFGQKIAENVVHHARLGSLNLHASRLPKFRGAAPINAAILAGETVTGNSVIRLAQKMDAGAILGQSMLEIGELETADELHDRLAEDGAPLVLDVLEKLATGTAAEVEQDHAAATIAPKLSRDSAKIDWTEPAALIARKIRAMYPWPGSRVRLLDRDGQERDRLTLVRARAGLFCPSTASTKFVPGMIAEGASGISAGDGMEVELIEVQPEGKRPMALAAYRNGHIWKPGMRLESIA